MAITWTDFNNGDTLASIRGAINSFLGSVVTDVNTNTSDLVAVTTTLTNTTADATAALTKATTNETDIIDLQTKAIFMPSYTYIHGSNITVVDDTYEEIANLTTGSLEAGTYKLEQSMLYTLNSTNSSAYFRFSVNGGSTWNEVRREPKDNTDLLNSSYFTTVVHPGGVFNVQIQARKETAGDILVVAAIDVSFERKA